MDDLNAGFIHGILAGICAVGKAEQTPIIPRRFMKALTSLRRNQDIYITSSDKGGGVVILNRADYFTKMQDLLEDSNTYSKSTAGTIDKLSKLFNQKARKILKRSQPGKILLKTIEETPSQPKMYGLPKTHKPQIPMRPITSGIGSAPHKLAKILAQPLSRTLGSISNAHLKNSGDMKNRIKNIPLKNKTLVSFDVTALFTNVPTKEAMTAVERAINSSNITLPLPKHDFLELVQLCVNFNGFTFNGQEYQQIRGLAMGSPLSAVMACLFMEMLEQGPIKRIIGQNITWLRYVDDTLVIIPRRMKPETLLQKINEVHPIIKFTMEKEVNDTIPFLDTKIHRGEERATFSVFRKQTNKNDFIHFLSGHDSRTKSGVVIGFFLRALRICDPQFLEEEIQYIKETFSQLYYPRCFLEKTYLKAIKIHCRGTLQQETETLRIIAPTSTSSKHLQTILPKNVMINSASGQRIMDIVSRKYPESNPNTDSVVYSIPCNSCDKEYIGETHRGLNKRLEEHKRDLRLDVTSNALVNHRNECNHLPNIKEAKILMQCNGKVKRKLMESVFINERKNINIRQGSFKIPQMLCNSIAERLRNANRPHSHHLPRAEQRRLSSS